MAVPKKKSSRSRRNMRRFSSHNKIAKPTGVSCPNCHETVRPHRICSCGHYNGKAVLSLPQAQAE